MKPGTDLAGFKLALKNFTEKELPKKFCQLMAWTAFEVYARVLKRTPVDKGFLRGSWTVSLRAPAFEKMKTDAKFDDKPSQGEIDKSKVALDPLKFGEKIFISNRMPYVLVVEFGGYPNPPKRGTHLKKGQKKGAFVGPGWFQFSSGGFSLQAPRGMVAVSIEEVKQFIIGKDVPDVEVK